MLRLALSNLRANWTRLLATAAAVVVGVAFLAAGLMLTDAVRVSLLGTVEEQYANVDLAVTTAGDLADLGDTEATVSPLGPDSLGLVRAVPGVAAAAPVTTADVRVLRDDGEAVSLRTQGRPWIADEALNPLTLDSGRAPTAGGEVVLDRETAARAGLRTGSPVVLETPVGERSATVVGTSSFGRSAAVDPGGTVSFFENEAALVLGGGQVRWSEILVRTSGDPATVSQAIAGQLSPLAQVVTGSQVVEREQLVLNTFVDVLRPVLTGFAFLSLFVCAFVIFNTFSVVVTQRFRELALVRAVGGTPAQVRRSLLFEGLLVGLLASAVGLVVGAALSVGLQAVLSALDVPLPGAGVKVTTGTVVVGMVVGTLVTLLSVAVPAFRAGRTKPVEAMRTTAFDRSGTSTLRLVLGGAALAGAVGVLLGAKWGLLPRLLLGGGTMFMFTALVVGGPLLARVFSRVLSFPLRAFGLTGRLAADNCARNPRRTATTANALVIGLFLVTLVTVSGTAVKTWAVGRLNTLSGSDYIVGSRTGLPDDVVDQIRSTQGVEGAAAVRTVVLRPDGGPPYIVSTTDFQELATTSGVRIATCELETVATGDGVAVIDQQELLRNLLGEQLGAAGGEPGGNDPAAGGDLGLALDGAGTAVGDQVELTALDGSPVVLTVAATLRAKLDALALGNLVGPATFQKVAGEQPVRFVFVRTDPTQTEQVGLRLEQLTRSYTTVEVQPGNFIGQFVGQVLDFLINAVNALLGMSLFVALIGIVNTMTLSIFERRQELGMVRALGMTRSQVGAMVALESVLLGTLGTVVGVGTGLFLGWVLVGSLGQGISLNVDWGRIGLIALAGVAVGGLASLLPTRRATRVAVLEAMQPT
ncbi:MAG: ABC transporter permease [Actinomycetes bacterium]